MGAGAEAQQSLLQRMRVILSCPRVAIFLAMAVLFGIGMGTIDGFMFLYLKQLGALLLASMLAVHVRQ